MFRQDGVPLRIICGGNGRKTEAGGNSILKIRNKELINGI